MEERKSEKRIEKKKDDAGVGAQLSETLAGTFLAHEKGFGFVEVEGREGDLFVPPHLVNGAFHRDQVQVRVLEGARPGKRKEAEVLRILSRGLQRVVGTYERSGEHFGFVRPDDRKIPVDFFVREEHSGGAADGCKVVVEITDYGGEDKRPEGNVVEILGHIQDPGVDILSLIKGLELPVEFDQKVQNQAQRAAREVSEGDLAGRRDLRDVPMVTIDGENARDLDDTVSLVLTEEGYRLGVHIADVANYVQEGSALDREALKRGTSVYLTDRVIPMLPQALSNGICSLNAGEDRLSLSCLMTVNGEGEIVDYEICESVIRVDRRMSYSVVKAILEDERAEEREAFQAYRDFIPVFRQMAVLSSLLRKRRKSRGAVDFDFPECRITLDDYGRPLEIQPYERSAATDLIEDFMLAANETVAQHFYWLELPFVYRVHDVPDPEKIMKLSALINNLGYYMKSIGRARKRIGDQEIHSGEIQKLLERVAGTPEEALVSRLALRSMKQARYSTESTGHFGLASQFYCHFTSPIRRYPDLQVHRIIKDQLRGRLTEEKIAHYEAILPEVCSQCSRLERRADWAEREADKLKKAEYMKERLGNIFSGVISGITGRGIFVELPDTVEGMIPAAKLPGDFYIYRESSYEMVGENTGRSFQLGMPLKVLAVDVDLAARTVEFGLVEEDEKECGPESGPDWIDPETEHSERGVLSGPDRIDPGTEHSERGVL